LFSFPTCKNKNQPDIILRRSCHLWFLLSKCVLAKNNPLISGHSLCECRSIFSNLSLTDSQVNSPSVSDRNYHLTFLVAFIVYKSVFSFLRQLTSGTAHICCCMPCCGATVAECCRPCSNRSISSACQAPAVQCHISAM